MNIFKMKYFIEFHVYKYIYIYVYVFIYWERERGGGEEREMCGALFYGLWSKFRPDIKTEGILNICDFVNSFKWQGVTALRH